MRKYFVIGGVILAAGLFIGVYEPAGPKVEIRPHDVTILRDTWGVPHVFGKTDVDTAFGLAYAHCEDDAKTITESLLSARGMLASVQGKDAAPIDYMVKLFRTRELVDAKYATDLTPQTRAICEAYAEGVMKFAQDNPGVIDKKLLPLTGKDVVAGFVFKSPFFFGLDNAVKDLFGPERKKEVATKMVGAETEVSSFLTGGLPIGSNTMAVAPSRSADGATRININSHQPWEGQVSWYEAHVRSEEGWDCYGGIFPGTPVILHGINRNLGWAHTVNKPDLIDIYVLDMNPENENQYKFDGEWKDLEVKQVPIKVKIWGPISWTVKREALWSNIYNCPVVRQPHGVYAIRWAGMDDIRQVEQWYRMDRAQDLNQWMEAMRMQAIPSLNCGYADKDGNIMYLYNARFPKRNPAYDWKKYLPGNTSETLWTEYVSLDADPQILNPKCGYIYNSNNTPYEATADEEDLKPEDFSPTFGIETHMSNRALRAKELLAADTSISKEDFYAIKYDKAYSQNSEAVRKWKLLAAAPDPADPLAKEALDVLRKWDFKADGQNTAAAISILTVGPDADGGAYGDSVEGLTKLMSENAKMLKEAHGKIDVPWSEVNRIYRGEVNVGVDGGPDTLRAIYATRITNGELVGMEKGQIHGRGGDCYVLIASWKEGKVSAESIHQFGSATLDKKSKHYADQVPLFMECKMKPVWMDETDIRANLEREYRPGDLKK